MNLRKDHSQSCIQYRIVLFIPCRTHIPGSEVTPGVSERSLHSCSTLLRLSSTDSFPLGNILMPIYVVIIRDISHRTFVGPLLSVLQY